MSKPLMIRCVSQSISIDTKNQASPNVTSAYGRVTSLRTGFSTVLRIPKTSADQITVEVEPWKVTEPRTQPTLPRTLALTAQETSSHRTTAKSLLRTADVRSGEPGCLDRGNRPVPQNCLLEAAKTSTTLEARR